MTRAVVLSGGGRYADRWHDQAATSQRLAELLARIGVDARIHSLLRPVMEDLSGVDLVVVNCSDGRVDAGFDGDDATWRPAHAGLTAHVARGGAVIGVHTAVLAFSDAPDWFDTLGGRWRHGESMHPAIGPASLTVHTGTHPVVADVRDFTLHDERYAFLEIAPQVRPLVSHMHDGVRHPLVWAHQVGSARVIYDALGHGVESYDSVERCRLFLREAAWVLHDDDALAAL